MAQNGVRSHIWRGEQQLPLSLSNKPAHALVTGKRRAENLVILLKAQSEHRSVGFS